MSAPVTPDFQQEAETHQGFRQRVTAADGPHHPPSPNPPSPTRNDYPLTNNPLTNFLANAAAGLDFPVINTLDRAIRRRYKFHDRGTGQYEEERCAGTKPYLVMTEASALYSTFGWHAGRSHLHFESFDWRKWTIHLWTKDFFTSIANINLPWICLFMLVVYTLSYLTWGLLWYFVWLIWGEDCLAGFEDSTSTFTFYTFSAETQATIGFGKRAVQPCWISAVFLTLQNVSGMILDAVSLGIIFAKISHPKHRGRSVLISECAVIARRNGLLKFMFRIADVRSHTACDAKVRAYLYTWGEGRHTMEGEHIPVRVECLSLGNVDGQLLLPLTLEHTIDERSPLYGLHHDLLEANNCEVVVTFEAVNEFGDNFMCRQSYLASEIHWGHVFTCIIKKAEPGSTHHSVDLSRFHDVEPQPGLPSLPPGPMSLSILATGPSSKMLPYPLLGENTLVISQYCTITLRNGRPHLMFRVGDTRPCQMLEVHVRMYLYRWVNTTTDEGEVIPYTCEEVDLGYEQGRDRLILRFPQTICHEITESSPLAPWVHGKAPTECPTELVVIVESVMYLTAENIMRTVTYRLPQDVRHNHYFAPMVSRATQSGTAPAVNWSAFHVVVPAGEAAEHPPASPWATPHAAAQRVAAKPSPSSQGAVTANGSTRECEMVDMRSQAAPASASPPQPAVSVHPAAVVAERMSGRSQGSQSQSRSDPGQLISMDDLDGTGAEEPMIKHR